MKNSLFKRAFAAASVVPLALTQCLSVANAVYINDSVVALTESANLAANKTEVTIDKIVTVEPGAGEGISSRGDGYIIYGADGEKITDEGSVKENAVRFEKYSEWYDVVSELILEIASGNNSSGTIDPSKLYDAVIARAGKYAETAEGVFEEIGDINYNVDIDGNITITASVGNITPVLTADGEKAMMETLKKLAEENNAPELAEEGGFFDDVVIAGDITVTLDASDIIMRGTSAVGEITFVDSQTGNIYKGSGIIDYAVERFEALDNTAKNKVAELKDKYDVDMTSVEKDINDSLGFYIDKLKYASEKVDVVLGLQESGNFASYSEATVWLNEKIDEKLKDRNIPVINKKVPEIPPTAEELASNKKLLDVYTDILNQLGQKVEGYDINITADDLAEFVDGMSNISFTVDNGNAVIVGEFPDAESEEAWAYLKEKYGYNEQYTYESYKEVTLTVNFDTITNAGGGLADADLQFKRILTVEYDPTITTTTTDTGTGITTTTTTDSDSNITTTTTTDTGTGITTTTTTDSDSNITTTTTTDTGTGITTTTTTDSDSNITTTTTNVTGENDSIIRASIETEVVGYYFSHDPRPFKAENVNVAKMWTKDAEGKEVDVEFDPSLVTFEEVNSKADNPEEAYDVENTTFKYTVNVFYDGKTLVDADDNAITITVYIGVKGDTNLDNMVDAMDASNIFEYYSNASTLGEGETIEDVRMSPATCKPVNENPELDNLCVFLADVDLDVYSKDNWRKTKSDREIDATDASSIFAYYSYMSTEGENAIPHEGWNFALPAGRGEKFDAYVESGKEE